MNSIPKRVMLDPDRVVSRGRGCFNCVSYSNDTLARQQWGVHKGARYAEIALKRAQGLAVSPAVSAAAVLEAVQIARMGVDTSTAADLAATQDVANRDDARIELLKDIDRRIMNGSVGICMKGKAGSDFVDARFLCDGWSGRDGHSLATGGKAGKLDKLGDELLERADDKARKL